jgi:hypothetical protein
MDKIKYTDPIFTDDQIHTTIQRILRLNPAHPHATRRTFGRRRLRQQHTPQLPLTSATPLPQTQPATNQFTICINHIPNPRLTQSLIESLHFCICCLCDQDHTDPTCPPRRMAPLLH